MSVAELRKKVRKRLNDLPQQKLLSLADYADFLAEQPSGEDQSKIARMKKWRQKAEREFAAGKGENWRLVRRDV